MSSPTPPTVGAPSDEYRAVCVYSHRHGAPQCDRPATVHVRTVDESWGEVALAACDEHAPVARAAGSFVVEHDYAGFCGFPGTVWLDMENVCALDDRGREPTRRALQEAVDRRG